MKDYKNILKSELRSFGISYADLGEVLDISPATIKQWFYNAAINDERHSLIKQAMKKVIENRFETAKRQKQLING